MAADLSRRQQRRIPIFFDLAYEWLLHDPHVEPMISVLPHDDLDIAYEIGTSAARSPTRDLHPRRLLRPS